MSLAQLQQQFSQALLSSESEASLKFITQIESTDRLSAPDRLNIYRQNYLQTMRKALANIYPVCEQLVGTAFFNTMAHFYQQAHPSTYPDIVHYTHHFPEFIQQYQAAESLPYLADVARLELLWMQAFVSSDANTIAVTVLADVPTENYEDIVLIPKKNCHLLASNYPIDKIWQLHQPEADPSLTVNLTGAGCYLVVGRKHYDIYIDALTCDEYHFMMACQQGLSLGEVIALYPDLSLPQILHSLLQRRYFTRLTIKETL
jgi:Putative DNA-binding domain